MSDSGYPAPPQQDHDRFPLWAIYAVLAALGVELAVWGAFLVPLRGPGGVEGFSLVIAVVGNIAVGVLAAIGTRRVPAAAVSGIAWLITVLVVGSVQRPADEVVIPGKLPTDPGIGVVGYAYFLAGAAAAVVAVLLANVIVRRFTASVRPPTQPG